MSEWEWSFTADSRELAAAMRSVAPFTSADSTLPTLCGVQVTLDGSNIVLEATDRFMLAVRELHLQDCYERQGSGSIVLPLPTVKKIAGLSIREPGMPVAISVRPDNSYRIAYPDDTVVSYPAYLTGETNFPRVRKLLAEWKAGERAHYLFNTAFLARFAKAAPRHEHVKLTAGPQPTSPVKFEFGETAGLIMPVRMAA